MYRLSLLYLFLLFIRWILGVQICDGIFHFSHTLHFNDRIMFRKRFAVNLPPMLIIPQTIKHKSYRGVILASVNMRLYFSAYNDLYHMANHRYFNLWQCLSVQFRIECVRIASTYKKCSFTELFNFKRSNTANFVNGDYYRKCMLPGLGTIKYK